MHLINYAFKTACYIVQVLLSSAKKLKLMVTNFNCVYKLFIIILFEACTSSARIIIHLILLKVLALNVEVVIIGNWWT